MEIPLQIFAVIIAGLFGAYLTIFRYAFSQSRDIEIDFSQTTILSVKKREVKKIGEFIETELSNQAEKREREPNIENYKREESKLQEKIRNMMEERWKNAYRCYKGEDLTDKLVRRESKGKTLCISGVVLLVISIILYLFPVPSNLHLYKGWLILLLNLIPVIIIAFLAIGNIKIVGNIRSVKKNLEKIWQF